MRKGPGMGNVPMLKNSNHVLRKKQPISKAQEKEAAN
jgi:hypothetical protein